MKEEKKRDAYRPMLRRCRYDGDASSSILLLFWSARSVAVWLFMMSRLLAKHRFFRTRPARPAQRSRGAPSVSTAKERPGKHPRLLNETASTIHPFGSSSVSRDVQALSAVEPSQATASSPRNRRLRVVRVSICGTASPSLSSSLWGVKLYISFGCSIHQTEERTSENVVSTTRKTLSALLQSRARVPFRTTIVRLIYILGSWIGRQDGGGREAQG